MNSDATKPYDHEKDLAAILGSPVKHVCGYVSREFGDHTFKLTRLILEDGRSMYIAGEHDFPYMTDIDGEVLKSHYSAE
jgi:hypothetical protein